MSQINSEEVVHNDMKTTSDNRQAGDDDDLFDRVLFLEEEILESSQKEGFIAGLHKGRRDGILMGERYGRSLGEELGFYIGFVNTWLRLVRMQEIIEGQSSEDGTVRKGGLSNSKLVDGLEKLKVMLESIPLHEPENPARDELLTTARAKFRTIIAQLGLSRTLAAAQKVDTLSF